MMKRLSGMLLILLLAVLFLAGCSADQAAKDLPADKSASPAAVTEAPRPAEKSLTAPAEEPPDPQNEDSAEENNENTIPEPTDQVSSVTKKEEKENRERITLLITKEFGRQVLFKKEVPIQPGYTVMDVLQDNLNMTTAFGGSYVKSIEGLESNSGGLSGTPADWFYYINGVCADAGAGDYVLTSGESVWWDYHEWKSNGFVNSAVIGSYPGPFVYGYRGKVAATIVMSAENHSALAAQLGEALKAQGVSQVRSIPLSNEALSKRTSPTIIMGTWEELSSLESMQKLNDVYQKNGTSIHFSDQGLELLDFGGKTLRTFSDSAGIIAAVGNGLGDKNPLWIIAGTDQTGLQQAAALLMNNSPALSGMYSVAVYSGEIIRLPLH